MELLTPIENTLPREPRSVLCVDQCAEAGGAQRSLLDLLGSFEQRGWNPAVAAPAGAAFSSLVRTAGHPFYPLPCDVYSNTRKPLSEQLRYLCEVPRHVSALARIARAHNSDLLYINGGRLFAPGAWLARRTGIPAVFHMHNRLVQPSAAALAGHAVEWSGGTLIACSHYAAAPLVRYLDARRIHIIYNGVASLGVDRRSDRRAPRLIGMVGRIEPEKGQLEFVRAARILAGIRPECRFLVVGRALFSGDEYRQQVLRESAGLPIDFLDWQEDLSTVYRRLDVLVVASTYLESTTRVIPEAFSAGVPVVAFASGGIPEILFDGVNGFLAAKPTAEALAVRLLEVLQLEPSVVAGVVASAWRTWREHYQLAGYRESVCRVLSGAFRMALA